MEVFLISFGITLGCGLLLVFSCRDRGFHLVSRQLYLLTSLSWVLMSLFVMSLSGRLTDERAETVEIVGLYWHFVDVVWVLIFTIVYLIP